MILRRGVPAPMMTALRSGVIYPVLFGHLDWPVEPVRVHTAVGPITWGGELWRGVGELGTIEIPAENASIASLEGTLSLDGIRIEDLDDYADDAIRGRSATLYLGCLTERPGGWSGEEPCELVSDPIDLFSGVMDGFTTTDSVTDDGIFTQAAVSVSTGVEARTGSTIYHTDENQRRATGGLDTAGRLVILAYANAQKTRWPAP